MDERAQYRTMLDPRYFRLLERISSGTSGSIWLAQKKESKEICALKVVRKDLLQSTAGVDTWSRAFCTTDPERHNFILSLDGFLNTQSSILLLTPYVAGGDLQSYVQQNGKLAMAAARFYAAELCHAIEFLHVKGLIHRNLGLEHVLLTANGHIRVTGFGVCKGGMEAESRTATFCGGIALAPEMLLDQHYGRPVDWWAFGILLFEMLEAASPFRGEDMDEIYDEILDSTKPEYPLKMPEVVKSILRQLLLRNPDKRLGTDGTGAERVKAHAFFEGINWDDVAQERILPPLLPAVTDHTDAIEADCETPAIPPGTLSLHDMDGHATFSDF